jgi:hypothetical protein
MSSERLTRRNARWYVERSPGERYFRATDDDAARADVADGHVHSMVLSEIRGRFRALWRLDPIEGERPGLYRQTAINACAEMRRRDGELVRWPS